MNFEVAIGIFLVAMIASRILSERALKMLSPEQKVQLLDAFSGMRAYSFIPLVIIFGAYYLLLTHSEISSQWINIGYWFLIIIFLIVNFLYTQFKLKQLSLPGEYLKRFGISRVIQYLGFGFFMVITLKNSL